MFSILSIQDSHDIAKGTNITSMSGKIDNS
jgi:hypothetical protein